MVKKIYKTYQELEEDLGEQSGQYVFEIKQKEIEELNKKIKSLELDVDGLTQQLAII